MTRLNMSLLSGYFAFTSVLAFLTGWALSDIRPWWAVFMAALGATGLTLSVACYLKERDQHRRALCNLHASGPCRHRGIA